MRFLAMLTWLAFFVAVAARADVRETESHFALYLPEASWKVSFVRDAWLLQTNNTRPDVPLYHLFFNRPKLLTFSIFVDTTTKCSSGASCRERFWRDAASNPGLGTITDSTMFERNGFHVVQFSTEYPQRGPRTTQVSAHAYRDGSWIDVRVSKTGRQTPDAAPLLEFIDSFTIGAKEPADLPITTVQYDVGDGAKVTLPSAWYFSNRLVKPDGQNDVLVKSDQIEITLAYTPIGREVLDADMERVFTSTGAQYASRSKERATNTQRFAAPGLKGLYATYTHISDEPGWIVTTSKKYRMLTDIHVAAGKGVYVIGIGSNGLDGPDYLVAMSAVKGLRVPERQ